MLRHLLSTAALVLLLTPRAEASPINLLLTVDYGGLPEVSLGFSFFESETNDWQSVEREQRFLAEGHATLLPGVTQFNVSLDAASLDNVYFSSDWTLPSAPNGDPNVLMAMPPTGPNIDGIAFTWGPPWIPLANLDGGFSGNYNLIIGDSGGRTGTWALAPAPDPLTPVPEPTSLLLLGSGLAALAGKRYRRSKNKDIQ